MISPGGIIESADAQRIDYREEDLAGCLIKIAQAVRRFHDLTNVTMIRLGPISAVEQISPLLDDPSFACTCQTSSRRDPNDVDGFGVPTTNPWIL